MELSAEIVYDIMSRAILLDSSLRTLGFVRATSKANRDLFRDPSFLREHERYRQAQEMKRCVVRFSIPSPSNMRRVSHVLTCYGFGKPFLETEPFTRLDTIDLTDRIGESCDQLLFTACLVSPNAATRMVGCVVKERWGSHTESSGVVFIPPHKQTRIGSLVLNNRTVLRRLVSMVRVSEGSPVIRNGFYDVNGSDWKRRLCELIEVELEEEGYEIVLLDVYPYTID